jgi:DNA-binding protein H-NS
MSTYRQLKQQIAELEKKAAIVMKNEVRKVIESIRRQIAEFGLTAADLGLEVARRAGGKARTVKKSALKPKYVDPVSGKTWNGHGKRPRWIVAAQDKGKLDDLLIEKAGLSKPAKASPTAKPAAKKAQKKAAARKPAAKNPVRRAAKKAAPTATKKAARTAPKKAARTAPKKAAPPGAKKAAATPKAPRKKPQARKAAPPQSTAAAPAVTETAPPAP